MRKRIPIDHMQFVSNVLALEGWIRAGETPPQKFNLITRRSYPFDGSPRYISPNGVWCASVGPRMVNFYKPENGKQYFEWKYRQFKTTDLDGVTTYAKMLGTDGFISSHTLVTVRKP